MPNKRLNGRLDAVKVFIKKSNAEKSKLTEWLNKYNELLVELDELEQMKGTLPQEIDALLSSGKMDNTTIELLAKKRAHLDLLPAREDKVCEAIEVLDGEFEEASAVIENTIRSACTYYYDLQMEAAINDLKQLGVSEEVAKNQALLRDDIRSIDPYCANAYCASGVGFGGSAERARRLLWVFESFEAGYHPRSKESEKFQKNWVPAS
ncbi:hypothetical protein P4E94_14795 [Pontiellaceae bacterium B12219]|nr:hypothetical protein [Pontiellaceae bacterium B12219]